MADFPMTQIEDLSVSRMLIGTNWMMGFSHTSAAQDKLIKQYHTRETVADIVEVFLSNGVNAILGGRIDAEHFNDGIREAEGRVGIPCHQIATPHFDLAGTPEAKSENMRVLDAWAEHGAAVCMPHQCTTDKFVDRRTRSLAGIEPILAAIRDRGMIPGLSTHMPEAPIYADETGLDVGTYIQLYNAAGFLMPIEIDWVQRMIWRRNKPVITIKPFAAGRIPPLVGLAFNWSTIREIDMVCVGCFTADEAREVIEMSRAHFEKRVPRMVLQETRSKASVKPAAPGQEKSAAQ